MIVKLHLFSGFENKELGITPDMELGHLYEDTNNWIILSYAAERIGVKQSWIQPQEKTGLLHFDLWGNRLKWAKQHFLIVDDIEFAADMQRLGVFRQGFHSFS